MSRAASNLHPEELHPGGVQPSVRSSDSESGSAPLSDFEAYLVVCRVIAQHVMRHVGRRLNVVIDDSTAEEIGVDLGALGHVAEVQRPNKSHAGQRTFAAYAEDFNIAATGVLSGAGDSATFQGVWSAYRPFVMAAVSSATASSELDAAENEDGSAADRRSELCSMSVAAAVSNHFAMRQLAMARDKDELASVLSILKSISAKRRAHDLLYLFVEQIAAVTGVDRCSIVRVWGSDNEGHVLASHEDSSVNGLVIDLQKYPEIRKAMDERTRVVVNDVLNDPLTAPFKEELRAARISAIIVIPIVLYDLDLGSFLLRAAVRGRSFSAREISFCEIVGEAASNALERAHLFESIQKANQRLERLAITDGLTGLFNYRHFRERLQEEFDRAKRYGVPLSCILLDIDNFKTINDTFGHLQGDSVLRELAERVARCARKSDLVARYGGEEIVALLPQTDVVGAKIHAERVLNAISSMPYVGLPDDWNVTASVGVAVLDPAAMNDGEKLIQAADDALYKAKVNGKNQVVVSRNGDQ